METRLDSLQIAINNINGKLYQPLDNIDGAVFYYILAITGKVIGISEPCFLFLWAQMMAAGILIASYPVMLYRLTKSFIVGVLAPYLVLMFFGEFLLQTKQDQYWALGWVIIFSVPLLAILFSEKWSNRSWYIYSALCVIVAIGNIVRLQASLPVLILIIVLVFCKLFWMPKTKQEGGKTHTTVLIFVKKNTPFAIAILSLFLSQTLLTNTIPVLVFRSITNEKVVAPTHYGPWHSAYIGLGWEENKYGIYYSDSCAGNRAREIDSSVIFFTEEYFNILRKEYFTLIRDDPGFFFGSYLRKFHVIVDMVRSYSIDAIGLTAPYAELVFFFLTLVLGVWCQIKKKWVFSSMIFCSIFCVFAGMLQAMVAVPFWVYLIGSYVSVSMLLLSAVLFIIVNVTSLIYRCLNDEIQVK